MNVIRHAAHRSGAAAPCVVTLGKFDGVHRGHREVLARLVHRAREHQVPSVAITFTPHPLSILAPARAPLALTSIRQRLALLAAAGVDTVVLQRFTPRFAQVPADRFVEEILVGCLRARAVVVGQTVGFGYRRTGTAASLVAFGRKHGFTVEVVPPFKVDGRPVTSTAVRVAIAAGDLAAAGRMLGRPYEISGRVVHGHHRGQQLGVPTANLRLRGVQLPPDGVYAARARIAGRVHCAVANIGFNPTFGDRERSVEAHVLDFHGDLYTQRLDLVFIEYLRGERRFPDVQALVAQIREDIAAVRRLLPLP